MFKKVSKIKFNDLKNKIFERCDKKDITLKINRKSQTIKYKYSCLTLKKEVNLLFVFKKNEIDELNIDVINNSNVSDSFVSQVLEHFLIDKLNLSYLLY